MRDAARLAVTDEDLSAFLDGELPPEALKAVAAALDTDEILRRRLEKLAFVDRVLASAYSAGGKKPMPAWVTALLADATPPQSGNINFRILALLAAAIALMIGAGAGFLAARQTAPLALIEAGAIDAASALHAALEGTPSGGTATLPAERRATIIGSFQPGREIFCREFAVSSTDGAARAIACRRKGVWAIEVAAPKDASSRAFETAARALGAGIPLTLPVEAKLLNSHWAN